MEIPKIKFHENLSSGSRLDTRWRKDGQTNIKSLFAEAVYVTNIRRFYFYEYC